MTEKHRTWAAVMVNLPVDVEQGKSGLFFVTSPLIKGLLIAERDKDVAVGKTQDAVQALAKAALAQEPLVEPADEQLANKLLHAAGFVNTLKTADLMRLAAERVKEIPRLIARALLAEARLKDSVTAGESYVAENNRLRAAAVPVCIGPPLISILAKEGAWQSSDGRSVVAADALRGNDPYVELDRLRAEVARLHERLEDNHVFELRDGEMVRVEVEPGSLPDGIDCRNETIKLQDANNDRLRARVAELQDAAQKFRDVIYHRVTGHEANTALEALDAALKPETTDAT